MNRMRAFLATYLLAALLTVPAMAVEPAEMLPDPALEARAREVSKALRCVVCQNQAIDDSDAELALDMRLLVRRRIVAGDSNADVLHYMQERYGDFVLLEPRFTAATLLLWLGPALLLLLGAIALRRTVRGRGASPAPLNADEAAAIATFLNSDSTKEPPP